MILGPGTTAIVLAAAKMITANALYL